MQQHWAPAVGLIIQALGLYLEGVIIALDRYVNCENTLGQLHISIFQFIAERCSMHLKYHRNTFEYTIFACFYLKGISLLMFVFEI